MTKLDWQINIESLAESVAEKYGSKVAESAFIGVGASCFEELNPSDYEEVFSNLMQMDAD